MNSINLENSEIIQVVFFILLAFLSMFLVLVLFFYFSRKKIVQIEVEKKNMPLRSYTMMHKNARLSDDERKTLVDWCNVRVNEFKEELK